MLCPFLTEADTYTETLIIPEGITEICEGAFDRFTRLTQINGCFHFCEAYAV